MTRSYRDSDAFRRSQRLRADGTPVLPLTDADVPSVTSLVRVLPPLRALRLVSRARAGGGL